MFLSLSLSRSNADRYVAAYSTCIAKAETIRVPEIAAFWQAIANQYKFLYERKRDCWKNATGRRIYRGWQIPKPALKEACNLTTSFHVLSWPLWAETATTRLRQKNGFASAPRIGENG
jgi:hypothetical protein